MNNDNQNPDNNQPKFDRIDPMMVDGLSKEDKQKYEEHLASVLANTQIRVPQSDSNPGITLVDHSLSMNGLSNDEYNKKIDDEINNSLAKNPLYEQLVAKFANMSLEEATKAANAFRGVPYPTTGKSSNYVFKDLESSTKGGTDMSKSLKEVLKKFSSDEKPVIFSIDADPTFKNGTDMSKSLKEVLKNFPGDEKSVIFSIDTKPVSTVEKSNTLDIDDALNNIKSIRVLDKSGAVDTPSKKPK